MCEFCAQLFEAKNWSTLKATKKICKDCALVACTLDSFPWFYNQDYSANVASFEPSLKKQLLAD